MEPGVGQMGNVGQGGLQCSLTSLEVRGHAGTAQKSKSRPSTPAGIVVPPVTAQPVPDPSEQTAEKPSRHCLMCDYLLLGLETNRCPECGREFDPHDPATYRTKPEPEPAGRKTFDVFKHPRRGYVAVKRGFSWPAFFFTFIWAFIKQLWWPGLALFLVLSVLQLLIDQLDATSAITLPLRPAHALPFLQLAVGIFVGYKGNEWRRNTLRRRGYELVGRVSADTPAAAVMKLAVEYRPGQQWRPTDRVQRTVIGWLLSISLIVGWEAAWWYTVGQSEAARQEAARQRALAQLRGHVDQIAEIAAIAISASGTEVLTGRTDGTAILWDLETGAELRTFVDRQGPTLTNPVAISPDGSMILTGAGRTPGDRGRGFATLWDMNGRKLVIFRGEGYYIDALAFSPDGTRVVTCGGGRQGITKGVVKLWDLSTGQLIRTMEGFRGGSASAVAFAPDGSSILAGSGGRAWYGDSMAILWDAETGEQLQAFAHGPTLNEDGSRRLNTAVNAVAFLPDGKTVVTAGSDEVARFFDITTGEELKSIRYDAVKDRAARLAVAPDGSRIALPDGRGTVSVWDIATGDKVRSFAVLGDMVTSLAFTPDGTLLLVGSGFNQRKVPSVAVSPDGTLMEVRSSFNPVGVWNVDTGQRVRTLGGHEAPP